jgi:hypothetical protein
MAMKKKQEVGKKEHDVSSSKLLPIPEGSRIYLLQHHDGHEEETKCLIVVLVERYQEGRCCSIRGLERRNKMFDCCFSSKLHGEGVYYRKGQGGRYSKKGQTRGKEGFWWGFWGEEAITPLTECP